MTKHKNESQKPVNSDNEGVAPEGNKKKLYDVSFFKAWCKTCGLCKALCPKEIITTDKTGFPEIVDRDLCTGCRFCEKHCPDFAISVVERTPKRRKTDG